MYISTYLPTCLSNRYPQIRKTLLLLSLSGLLASCASAPEAPVSQIQAAEQAIAAAERITASDYALPELLEARADLVSARAACLLYTSPSPRDVEESRMPSSA